ncbi:hypothetical protein GCM10027294_14780 [Marinactinospora endophytica]
MAEAGSALSGCAPPKTLSTSAEEAHTVVPISTTLRPAATGISQARLRGPDGWGGGKGAPGGGAWPPGGGADGQEG